MRLLLSSILLLAATSASAARAVMEGITASANTVLVSTANKRVTLSTGAYGGGVSDVSLYTTSNVVVGANNKIVMYASGTIVVNGSIVPSTSTSGGSSAAHYYNGVSSGTGSNATSVTFSGFSSSVSYRMSIQVQSVSAVSNTFYLRFNGDSGATYAWTNWTRRTCAGDASAQGESATSCQITGAVDATHQQASITFTLLKSAYGSPFKIHTQGTMSFDGSCGGQQGSGGSFTCGYYGSADFSSFTFGKTSGTFNYEIKIEKSDF